CRARRAPYKRVVGPVEAARADASAPDIHGRENGNPRERLAAVRAPAPVGTLPDGRWPLRLAGTARGSQAGHPRPPCGWPPPLWRPGPGHEHACAGAEPRAAPAGERWHLRGTGRRPVRADAPRGASAHGRPRLDACLRAALRGPTGARLVEGPRVLRAYRRAGVSPPRDHRSLRRLPARSWGDSALPRRQGGVPPPRGDRGGGRL